LTTRTGEEGFYPNLEAKIQKRLFELDPVNYPIGLSRREQFLVKEKVSVELAVIFKFYLFRIGKRLLEINN
jgi:hypothetical protein